MKIFFSLLALLALACALDIPTRCSKKNGSVTNAIGKFCQNKKMVVPSKYATNGMMSNNAKVWVSIQGSCRPAQWVPQEYCMKQFYQMCVNGDALGNREARFGRNKCQKWTITAYGR